TADRLGVRLGAPVVGAVQRAGGGARTLAGGAPDEVDVDAHGHPFLLGDRPEGIVLVADRVTRRRPARDHDALEAARLGLAQRLDHVLDTRGRQLRHAHETRAIRRAELVPEEVVVRVDAGAHEIVVVVTEEVTDRALRWKEDLDVDAVDVHVGEPGGAVVATFAGLLVRDARPSELVPRQPGCRDEPDGIGIRGPREEPRVTTLGVLHQARRLVLERRGQPRRPDVRWFEDVRIRGDDAKARHAGQRSLTRVSGSLLEGVAVADRVRSKPTVMAVRILADLGADVVDDAEAADVVIADVERPPSDADAPVWVCVTPFGATGPRAGWRASDLGVMAASGNLYCTGDPDRAPVRCAGDAAYAHTAPELAFAVLTALAGSTRPVDVDVSMQEIVLVANMGAAGRYHRSKFRGRRAGAAIGRTREIWPTKDGWVSFGLRGGKARIPSLETIARLVDEPVLTSRDWTTWDVNSASDEDIDAVQGAVGAWFATKTTAELYEIACETNLMLAPVNSPRELYASAQLAARQFFAPDGTPEKWAHLHVHHVHPVGPVGPEPPPTRRSDGENRRETPERTAQTAGGAWAGTHILEFGAGAAGPIATRYFAEHGATVLRVESASRPDFLRTGSYADMFDALNCGKRSVTLNLKHPDGHALAQRLVREWADAVAENFAPRAMRGLGLAYD